MSDVTIQGLYDLLVGIELGGVASRQYEVNFAVPNSLLGISRGNNKSGLSFGLSQLDIGNNPVAANAYLEILNDAVQNGTISQSHFNSLIRYNNVQRPDLDPNLSSSYRNDIRFLEQNVFSQQGAQNIIDRYTNQYVTNILHPAVDTFLDTMYAKYGSSTVFHPSHPDFHTAVAAVTSIANRTGDLGEFKNGSWTGSTGYFLNSANAPMTLADVKQRYDSFLGDHWDLVQVGGALYKSAGQLCFLAGTMIDMWPDDPSITPNSKGLYDEVAVRAKVLKKPIEQITPEDIVVSYDKNGNLQPGHVTRTFQNEATHILDFWGTGVTPGHAYLCGDGKHEGEHIPLIDILRQDGAIVLENGTKVRAAINWPVGSLPDQFIWVLAGHDDGQKIQVTDKKQIRIGTRMIAPDGSDDCILDRLVHTYGPLSKDGFFENGTDVRSLVVYWPYGDKIPNPEDYILQRSDLTLEEIYAANEWEQIGTRMPPPSTMVGFNPTVARGRAGMVLQASKPAPNIPPAFAEHPDVPSGATKLNREQRKAMEAHKRRTASVKICKLH